jgi:DNA polymerase-3 subunit gamma/tau
LSYLVLARKWRPQTFSDLIGQEHVSQTLQNAIDSGRIAHAFLFTGARGVGKTSSARILAKALNCEKGTSTEPCNVCSACTEITNGSSVDVAEIDGASNNSVDDIRDLRDNVKYLPSRSRFKIFIIDEVHMLSASAFNALLKTLEEPPPHVKFIFATTEPHKVPITILSRCQRFDFKRISLQKIVARLRYIVDQEKVVVSDTALAMVARKGDGSMRDALSTLDQVMAFCDVQVSDDDVATLLGVVDRQLLQEAATAVIARDSRGALEIVKRVDSFGYNMRQFCQELIEHFRCLTIIKAVDDAAELLDLSEKELGELQNEAAGSALVDLQRYLSVLLKAEYEMAHASYPRLVLEMALLKMVALRPVLPVRELLDRLKALEDGGGIGMVAAPGPVWERTPPQTAPRPPQPPKNEATAPAPRSEAVNANARIAEPPAEPEPVPIKAQAVMQHDSWQGFVAFVMGKKPMLASLLEHGRPLKISPCELELGFQGGSFQLSRFRDPETHAELKGLADAYFNSVVAVRIVSLEGEVAGLPPTLQEKKSLDETAQRQQLMEEAMENPMVAAALEILGGEVGSVIELKTDEKP